MQLRVKAEFGRFADSDSEIPPEAAAESFHIQAVKQVVV